MEPCADVCKDGIITACFDDMSMVSNEYMTTIKFTHSLKIRTDKFEVIDDGLSEKYFGANSIHHPDEKWISNMDFQFSVW